jgi:hypothetical protein
VILITYQLGVYLYFSRAGIGVKAMTSTFWTRKAITLGVTIVAVTCTVTFLSAGLTQPKPFVSAVLSDQWQCTKTAGIITVCIKKGG